MPIRNNNRRSRKREPAWVGLSDQEILDLRFCDLDLTIEGSELVPRIRQLYEELEERGLRLRPPCWLSSEWFSPQGAPGIAIPFYLAHPRLKKLEERQMKDVEGGTRSWCMQLLRHEAGHAYEVAYRLNRRKRWQQTFGNSSMPYPDYYSPRPSSRKFVLHLDWWYAQSHPVEDFAETFAVWLRPGSEWRRRYKDWPALKKLAYVDELMAEIAGQPPFVRSGPAIEPLRELRQRLRDYYRDKQERYGSDYPEFYDQDLRVLFPPTRNAGKHPPASQFLRRLGPELPRRVASWTGQYAYTINLVLKDMIQRARELKLRVSRPEKEIQLEAAILLTMQTMNYLHRKRHYFAV
ncbi:MAG: putative zinc-binding metallopeptidase [Terriglobia bacterium]